MSDFGVPVAEERVLRFVIDRAGSRAEAVKKIDVDRFVGDDSREALQRLVSDGWLRPLMGAYLPTLKTLLVQQPDIARPLDAIVEHAAVTFRRGRDAVSVDELFKALERRGFVFLKLDELLGFHLQCALFGLEPLLMVSHSSSAHLPSHLTISPRIQKMQTLDDVLSFQRAHGIGDGAVTTDSKEAPPGSSPLTGPRPSIASMTDSLTAARNDILKECASKMGRPPPENWASWDNMGNHEAHALFDLAAHELQDLGLIEARFLPSRAGFAAWITAKGIEHLKAAPQLPTLGTYAFIDTNVVLRGQPLKDIDWKGLLKAQQVDLVLCRAVVDELLAKRYDRDQWLQERARKGNAQLQDIASAGHEVREGVRLLTANGELDREQLRARDLIYDHGDDRIIGAALKYRGGDPAGISLVSFDNNLLNRAPAFGFGAFKVPDKYRLPIPADPRDAENRRLSAVIEELRSTLPHLELFFGDGSKELTITLRECDEKAIALDYVREWTGAGQIVEAALSGLLQRTAYASHLANDVDEFWKFASAQGAAEEKLVRCQPVGFSVRNTSHHAARGVRVVVHVPSEVEEISPKVEFPDEPKLRDPIPPVQGVHFRKHMPRFMARPIRMTAADQRATPGVSGPYAVEAQADAFRYSIQGEIKDRDSATLPEVTLLLRRNGSSRAVLRYEVQATGVPDNTFVGELVIKVQRVSA